MKCHLKLLAPAGSLLALALAGPACADPMHPNDWYFGAGGDLTWLRHSDMGGGGHIALGHGFDNFRLEAEAGYHGAGGSDGYSSTHYFTYMGNLYYDFNTLFPSSGSGWHVAPYIGGGLGDAAVHYGTSSFGNTFRHHENDFAWEGMAGLNFVSSSMPRTDWALGYRYLGTDTSNLHANSLELALRFHF